MTLQIDLSGRRVLITGAGQGVGRGLAHAFATAGAEVLVNDLRPARAVAVAEEVQECGGHAAPVPFDVTDFEAVVDAVAALDGVDILVNNAGNAGAEGFAGRGPFAESEPADWEPYLQVNLYGVLHCTRAVLPAMVAGTWGRIITIVSDAGRTGDANGAAYAASKAGAAGFTRSVAVENGRYGITANNIALGTMRTPLTEPLWAEHADSPQAKAILQNYAIRRPGNPDDAAALAVLLASDSGSWITGQTIPVNGGFSFAM
ncbi:SDR family NAD(P)-dependent oxidoreductase [Mycolicibacterium holsaticum]|uniref:3-oxoacyl-[acyl-carrier-protein] reductase MabA n=1 Tax=Mycolicibacterium holsaticum TaxID=152142 RepID=A0A1E3RZE2_9MYCO|nr:SDR family oxidoreductase [Mycolicibacterium holsaticum]MDA4106989.1 oxidoreductase [Mycolicibacterium holsaticum DSM 44478 = JCM 12374]ODQ95286.1 oxidoreductase [Mycolicibacterium holsaticum]QZA12332.1 SDR family oxidoreductase [Mycolicibacterium holsaticum DSM 44478 = JCM 12374]UNC10182.1 SDR family oxidoreductase [Mycolicibacterium holsaticum DSM 44478 = JCM 12374]